eukprot:scaffold7297_cov125-Isochrysis_galbana.AAC.3
MQRWGSQKHIPAPRAASGPSQRGESDELGALGVRVRGDGLWLRVPLPTADAVPHKNKRTSIISDKCCGSGRLAGRPVASKQWGHIEHRLHAAHSADDNFDESAGQQWLILEPVKWNKQTQMAWRYDPSELAPAAQPRSPGQPARSRARRA